MSYARTLASLIDGSNIVVPSGFGLDFSANASASGVTSEILNDFEEGIWTAGLNSAAGSVTIDSSYDNGEYIKIGNFVWVNVHARVSSISSPSGELSVTGLPFTRRSGNASGLDRSGVFIWAHNIGTSSGASLQGYISASVNTVRIQEFNNGVIDTSTADGVTSSPKTEFNITCCYIAS